jgi:hypothetical protein
MEYTFPDTVGISARRAANGLPASEDLWVQLEQVPSTGLMRGMRFQFRSPVFRRIRPVDGIQG